VFTPVHDAWWAAACKAHGDTDGTRALIDVLLLHRHMRSEHVLAGLSAALQVGALTADAVALEARKAAERATSPSFKLPIVARTVVGPSQTAGSNVSSLTERRIRSRLPVDTRPLPDLAKYDTLLPSHRRHRPGGPL
jgi:hypothetical protein